jgi:hypothetical protein
MARSPREQRLYLLSLVFAAAPFAFGLIRFLQTGSDVRMLWMAVTSFVGASVVMAIGRARGRERSGIVVFSLVTLIVATLCAGLTAIRFGATRGPGAWAVAFVLGLCWAMRYALAALSRSPTT